MEQKGLTRRQIKRWTRFQKYLDERKEKALQKRDAPAQAKNQPQNLSNRQQNNQQLGIYVMNQQNNQEQNLQTNNQPNGQIYQQLPIGANGQSVYNIILQVSTSIDPIY